MTYIFARELLRTSSTRLTSISRNSIVEPSPLDCFPKDFAVVCPAFQLTGNGRVQNWEQLFSSFDEYAVQVMVKPGRRASIQEKRCVCVCARICVRKYARVHLFMCTYLCPYTYMCVCSRVHGCVYVCTFVLVSMVFLWYGKQWCPVEIVICRGSNLVRRC